MADQQERGNDLEESLRYAVERQLSTVWTSLPVKVLEDSDGHIVKLQATIKGWLQQDGQTKAVPLPEFGMVPIHFGAGGGFTITHPIKENDEGIAIFASRCIDGWWKEGGVQAEPYRRKHNLSDAMYIPGIRNKPRKLNPYVSKDAIQIRTDNQHFYVEVRDDMARLVYAVDKEDEGGGGGNGEHLYHEGENGGNGNGQNGQQEEEEKEKKTTPIMVVMVTEDKVKAVVFDEQGEEKSWFELTKEGEVKCKAPKKVTFDTPEFHITGKLIVDKDIVAGGEITAKAPGTLVNEVWQEDERAGGSKVNLSQHIHPQGNDSRGDKEQDTGAPKSGG